MAATVMANCGAAASPQPHKVSGKTRSQALNDWLAAMAHFGGCGTAVLVAPGDQLEQDGALGLVLLRGGDVVEDQEVEHHLPLYRQSKIFERDGIDLDRSTLADWVGKSTALLEPLTDAIGRHVLAGQAIFADDTGSHAHL